MRAEQLAVSLRFPNPQATVALTVEDCLAGVSGGGAREIIAAAEPERARSADGVARVPRTEPRGRLAIRGMRALPGRVNQQTLRFDQNMRCISLHGQPVVSCLSRLGAALDINSHGVYLIGVSLRPRLLQWSDTVQVSETSSAIKESITISRSHAAGHTPAAACSAPPRPAPCTPWSCSERCRTSPGP